MIHTFAGNKLDRADTLRRDEDKLRASAEQPDSRYLVFSNLNVLVDNRNSPQLGWLRQSDIAGLNISVAPILLGIGHSPGANADPGEQPVAHFALDISSLQDPSHELGLADSWQFKDCRLAAMELPDDQTGVIAQARSQLEWHSHHTFCSRCGQRTEQQRGGHARHCESCKADHFPRTDPVVIMLISDGERCLLGQSAAQTGAYKGFYSTLAGFVDQGESIEEAVRREIMEEAGIVVGDVQYHSSQPWPFPSSLMIGCSGLARSTDITIDTVEMADVRWFDRGEVRRSLAKENAGLKLPGPFAIAHHLIKSWAEK
ncbi:MAG: NAD+ diphosphatase [Paraglaciecola psychrophila]|jgi:NAD+ diphosphatase